MNRLPLRILIVDDNQANRELLEAHLAGLDCEL
jgi:CheY-like chemotaxis protein